jgi:hypothetical protein
MPPVCAGYDVAVRVGVGVGAQLARASDREAYKKDALALRSEIAELSATLQEHHSDGWIVAVAELEKQVLEGVEVRGTQAHARAHARTHARTT